jgi:nucleoside 2-deoxyribosyltransferase
MWFAPELHEAFELGLAKAVSDCGYFPFRIDKKEHANKIDDEIIAEIRKSRFLIVDFTGHRGGAYFEAGFAMGIGLPIIWTCRKDHMAELHFDIHQYNCIDWSTIAELRQRLAHRIEAWIGRGGQITS